MSDNKGHLKIKFPLHLVEKKKQTISEEEEQANAIKQQEFDMDVYYKNKREKEIALENQLELVDMVNSNETNHFPVSPSNITEASDNNNNNDSIIQPHEEYQRQKTQKVFYRKLGKCFAFFSDENGDPSIIIGPQWFMYIILTIVMQTVAVLFLAPFWKSFSLGLKLFGILTMVIFQITYTVTYLINPGYPKADEGRYMGIPKEKYRYCRECKFYVQIDKKVNHCYDCGICIEGYDHHCPWTSKCIGRRNLYWFYAFITSSMLGFAFYIFALTMIPKEE